MAGTAPVAILAALLVTAVPAAGADAVAADPAAIDRFVLHALPLLPGTSTVPITAIRSLGALERESVRKVVNPLDPIEVDEFRSFGFDGLEIYRYVGDQEELWPIRVTVTGSQWQIGDGQCGIGGQSYRGAAGSGHGSRS